MAELAVAGPFDEGDLDDDLRTHPMRALSRKADGLCERRLRDLERVESGPQVEQEFRIETGAHLAREHEVDVVALRLGLRAPRALSRGEVADEQRAEADPRALRIGEATHHELL